MRMQEEYEDTKCDYQGEDGSCHCEEHCVYQTGKWRDFCGAWEESEDEESDET
jgi:hypothetical protein